LTREVFGHEEFEGDLCVSFRRGRQGQQHHLTTAGLIARSISHTKFTSTGFTLKKFDGTFISASDVVTMVKTSFPS
jgi:hypothetical protein